MEADLRQPPAPKRRLEDAADEVVPVAFASLLIAQGEHPKLISEQLGHASVQITLDRYGHLLPASYDSAGERLELALFGTGLQASASSGSSAGVHVVPQHAALEGESALVMPLSAAGGGTT